MEEQESNLGIPIIASLLIHILLVLMAAYYYNYRSYDPPEKEEIMVVDLKNNFQIADIAKPKVEQRPTKARHMGVYDSTVKDETVADFSPRAPGRPVHRGGEGIENIKKPTPANDGAERIAMMREKKRQEFRMPSTRLPEDFYPDFKRGPHTYINVMKHQDVGYFVQLKRIFKLAWDPTHALRAHYTAGEVSRGSMKVVLGISISKTGELDELFVINSSGLKGYDHEALRAVRASSPFHAPPAKLITKDGKLRVSWTFVVYM